MLVVNLVKHLQFHLIFSHIKVVNDKLTTLASTIDFGKCIKKSDTLSIEEECRMFAETIC